MLKYVKDLGLILCIVKKKEKEKEKQESLLLGKPQNND